MLKITLLNFCITIWELRTTPITPLLVSLTLRTKMEIFVLENGLNNNAVVDLPCVWGSWLSIWWKYKYSNITAKSIKKIPVKEFIFNKIANLQHATKIFKPLEVLLFTVQGFCEYFNTTYFNTLMSGDHKRS